MKKNNIFFVIPLIFLYLIIISNSTNNNAKKNINYKELVQNGAILLDVRTIPEFNENGLTGAVNLPVDNIMDITNLIPNKETQVIIYCRSGNRSKTAYNKMKQLGYNNIYDMGSYRNY